ncbi:MAG: hypothetical protein FVQ83_05830 [Chloroflexi bacterium]|nr:hypothetical protein [Chloroflexota bacterium]
MVRQDPKFEGIDIVYTWVDGDNPAFQEMLKKSSATEKTLYSVSGVGNHRFRDNKELRYSLRSVEKFAPWVRTIHILTNGQHPIWLDLNHPKISLVSHHTVFKESSHLPTFNSHSIELNLHRIPGLSQKFLYFNDDIFLGRAVLPEDFIIASGGHIIYLDDIPIPTESKEIHDQAYAYTQNLVEQQWGQKYSRLVPAHLPQLYDRDILIELEQQFSKEYAETCSHKFRAANDVALKILYFYALLDSADQKDKHKIILLPWGSPDYRLLMLKPSFKKILRDFREIFKLKPKYFCVNDDLADKIGIFNPGMLIFKIFMRLYFPQPSSMELKE